jgi:hypothetical protein
LTEGFLSTICVDINKERKDSCYAKSVFVKENLVDPYIVAIDSSLLRAKGHIWHKSSMVKGVVPPRSGILIQRCQMEIQS